MAIGVAFHGMGSLVMTDRRWTNPFTQSWQDVGGRLLYASGAWLAVTGNAGLLRAAVEALRQVDCSNPDAVAAKLREVGPKICGEMAALHPNNPSPPDKSAVVVACKAGVGTFLHDGTISGGWQESVPGRLGKTKTEPPILHADPALAAERDAVLQNGLAQAENPAALIRAMAAEFAWVAERDRTVSRTVDCALHGLAMQADASWIVGASDEEIYGKFAPPTDQHRGMVGAHLYAHKWRTA